MKGMPSSLSKKKCANKTLTDVQFSECTFVSEGDYFVIFTLDAHAKCESKSNPSLNSR